MKIEKLIILLTLSSLLISCVGHHKIAIPLSEEETLFYQSIDGHPLTVDSVSRTVYRTTFEDKKTVVDVEIFVRVDSLKQFDTDIIAEQVIRFNAGLILNESIIFDECQIYIQNNTYGSASYRYDIVNSKYERIDYGVCTENRRRRYKCIKCNTTIHNLINHD